ncbi:MAG: acyl-CoA/acyl-ACP dehydrogenase [Verrucomicrobiales bacterium]|nr:acyl-CoA/acyl-ACP dehydrogenase [Verrucomicrobiales bacterium]
MYRLTPEQQAIADRAAALADEKIAPFAAEVDEKGRFPSESMTALAEAGFWGLLIPEELGGMGQGPRTMVAVVDQIAQRCGSTAMVFMMHLSGTATYLADPVRFATQLRAAAEGRHLSTLAFSEKGSRSHFWVPVSQAKRTSDPDVVTLSAEKSWVTSAGIADGMVVSCQAAEGEGIEAGSAAVFVVMKSDPGVSVTGGWSSLGMRGNQSNPMTLQDVSLKLSERLIGEDGKGLDVMLGKSLPIFQLCQGAIGVGLCEAAFSATQGHLTGQKFQYSGSSLADLPNLRARLTDIRVRTDQARAYLSAVVDKVESGAADAVLYVLAAKISSGESAVHTTDVAMRACGGAAFSKHLGLERVFRDARAAVVMAPTTDALHDFVGRALCGMPLFG